MTLNEFIKTYRATPASGRGKCFYCGVQTQKHDAKPHHAVYQTKDHVIPASVKGWDVFVESRVVCCCRRCNSIKADFTLQEFKILSNMQEFWAETAVGVGIESLDDLELVTAHILSSRAEGRVLQLAREQARAQRREEVVQKQQKVSEPSLSSVASNEQSLENACFKP